MKTTALLRTLGRCLPSSLVFALAVVGLRPAPLPAQVPNLIHYQGHVVTNAVSFDGTGQFKFALVNGDGTVTFWSNDASSAGGAEPATAVALPVAQGLYDVLLGDTSLANMTVIPPAVFANSDVRLRVWFITGAGPFEQLSPDQRVAAVGYAMVANTVSDGGITDAKLATGAVTMGKLADGSVSSAKLASNAVTADKLAVGALSLSNLALPEPFQVGPFGDVFARSFSSNPPLTGVCSALTISGGYATPVTTVLGPSVYSIELVPFYDTTNRQTGAVLPFTGFDQVMWGEWSGTPFQAFPTDQRYGIRDPLVVQRRLGEDTTWAEWYAEAEGPWERRVDSSWYHPAYRSITWSLLAPSNCCPVRPNPRSIEDYNLYTFPCGYRVERLGDGNWYETLSIVAVKALLEDWRTLSVIDALPESPSVRLTIREFDDSHGTPLSNFKLPNHQVKVWPDSFNAGLRGPGGVRPECNRLTLERALPERGSGNSRWYDWLWDIVTCAAAADGSGRECLPSLKHTVEVRFTRGPMFEYRGAFPCKREIFVTKAGVLMERLYLAFDKMYIY